MAIIDALLKIDDANGNLKKITATEENYLAYQAGIQLAQAGISKVASLSTGSGATVGTYTDTKFDQAVGTHPGSSLTTTTTNTTIYQNTGTAPEDPPFAKPVLWDKDPGEIEAANDTQLNAIVDRLLLTIFASDYPGTYRLATSAPSGDYSAHLSNVFTDTRTDGTSVDYTIWKRQTMTPPTVVKTVKLQGTNGDLQQMSTVEMQATFGQRAKTRIMSTGIGTYQLRSSADGAPTDPGTWVAKGTATDTKQQTADQNYTRDSTRISTRDSTQNFTRISQSNYVSNYGAVYDGDYVGTTQYIAADYVGEYAGTYSGADFVGNYTADTYTGNYVATYTGPDTYLGNYLTNFTSQFAACVNFTTFYNGYARDFRALVVYDGNFARDFVGDYVGPADYSTDYLGEYTGDFIGNYISNYEGDYAGDYTPNYVGPITYVGQYDAAYQNEYTGDYTGDYVGNFIGDYLGNYIGDYAGETIQSSNETIETYTLYVRTA
jgi:hypothetical protein